MQQTTSDHLRVASAGAANVSLASANSFCADVEPVLRSLLLILQIVVAAGTAYYIFRKVRKNSK